MFLKKFVPVNWGNIPATDFANYEVRPINILVNGRRDNPCF